MNIKGIEISKEDIVDALTTALEGGSNYWYNLPNTTMVVRKGDESTTDAIIHSALNGLSIPVYDLENEDDILGQLSVSDIERGLKLYVERGVEFDPAMDADEADTLFQLIVMGEIVFG